MVFIQKILYFLLLVIVGIALYLSISNDDFIWFSRFGALISVIPILISIIEFYSDRQAIFYAKNNYAVHAPDNVVEQADKYWPKKIILNSIITIIGTVIWGFGDLINMFL